MKELASECGEDGPGFQRPLGQCNKRKGGWKNFKVMILLLLMEEILHHRDVQNHVDNGIDMYHINWCWILSINSM